MRLVSQYVQEFWECGWQPVDHINDKGIDGLAIMRHKGRDVGARINIQVKCGASYISSISATHLKICIDDEPGLKAHIDYWKRQIEPTILVFVNGSKKARDKHGRILREESGRPKWIDSRKKAQAWWVNIKDPKVVAEDTRTIIEIPLSQTFGEHSKGEMMALIRPLIDDNSLQRITLKEEGRKLYMSDNVRSSARTFYKDWKAEDNGLTYCESLKQKIKISRTGWLHITMSRRGKERRISSFRLLGAAKQLIQECKTALLLSQEENAQYTTQKFGLKARVEMKNESDKIVQVVILKRKRKTDGAVCHWFYSVHHRR